MTGFVVQGHIFYWTVLLVNVCRKLFYEELFSIILPEKVLEFLLFEIALLSYSLVHTDNTKQTVECKNTDKYKSIYIHKMQLLQIYK